MDVSEAKAFIENAKSAGSTPKIDGNWVTYTPPLPVVMMVTASRLANAIWRVLDAERALDEALDNA